MANISSRELERRLQKEMIKMKTEIIGELKGSNKCITKLDENQVTISLCFKLLWWICITIFTGIATYWTVTVINKYNSEPVTSTVTLRRDEAFPWPAVTVCPSTNCYNETARTNIKEKFNFEMSDEPYSGPFVNLETDWNLFNFSSLIKETYLRHRSDILDSCIITNSDGEHFCGEVDFFGEFGRWESYSTVSSPCHSFIPPPMTTTDDDITWYLKSGVCKDFNIAMHEPNDRFYRAGKNYLILKNEYEVSISVENMQEYNYVNRRVAPCIDDPGYSQQKCIEDKRREYLVSLYGCTIPVITGHILTHRECNDTTETFMHTIRYIWDPYFPNREFEKEKIKCLPSCHIYVYDFRNTKPIPSPDNVTKISLQFTHDSLRFLQVVENPAMTLDDLVANIGGTVGIFLGVSCLSGLSFIQYITTLVIQAAQKLRTRLNLNP